MTESYDIKDTTLPTQGLPASSGRRAHARAGSIRERFAKEFA
ncbi:MAG: hypothetical protein ACLSVD_12880 [Eggerthellaceae bacterium]